MIAAIAFGALGFVVVVASWSRFGSGRSQRRSVQEHQRALDVLGEVAKRRDGIAPVHAPSAQEIGRAHVHPTENAIPRFRGVDPGVGGHQPPARLVLRSGPTPLKLPIFEDATKRARAENSPGDEVHVDTNLPPANPGNQTAELDHVVRFEAVDSVEEVAAPTVPGSSRDGAPPAFNGPLEELEFGDEPQETLGSHRPRLAARPRLPRSATGRNPFILRRVASVAAIVIVLAAVGVGSWQLASSKSGPPPRSSAATPAVPPVASRDESGLELEIQLRVLAEPCPRRDRADVDLADHRDLSPERVDLHDHVHRVRTLLDRDPSQSARGIPMDDDAWSGDHHHVSR